jgi:hypothetical protein
MRIRVVSQSGEPYFPFSTSGPWVNFKNHLIHKNDTLINEEFGQKIDVLICHGYSKKAINEAKKSQVPKSKMILVLWEPPITHPKLHSNAYLSNFGQIYAPSKEWAKKHNAIYFKWPVGKIKIKYNKKNFNKRRKNAVIIQGNKVNFFKGENYSLRREVLFESLNLENPISLYGNGWNSLPVKEIIRALLNLILNLNLGISQNGIKHIRDKYPKFYGISKNKSNTLEKYKFAIVIENHNSYISEKIFDALNSGCVTIYIGAKLEEYGLNKNTAIQVDPNLESILITLEKFMSLSEKDIFAIHKTQKKYMEKCFIGWNNTLVLKNLALTIRDKINK